MISARVKLRCSANSAATATANLQYSETQNWEKERSILLQGYQNDHQSYACAYGSRCYLAAPRYWFIEHLTVLLNNVEYLISSQPSKLELIAIIILYIISDLQDAKLTGLLMKYFSKPSFRDWQLRIVSATIETKNSLVVMPTRASAISSPQW